METPSTIPRSRTAARAVITLSSAEPPAPSDSSTAPSPEPTRPARAVPVRLICTAVAAMVVATIALGVPGAIAGALAMGAAAGWVDLRTHRLPNRLVVLSAVAACLGIVAAIAGGTPSAPVGAFAGALGFAGPLVVMHLVAPAAIGFGDVKLAAALGLALGLVDPRLGILALCVASGVTATAGIATRRSSLPLGPGLVVGSALALVIGEAVWA